MMREGNTRPRVATTPPETPRYLCPTKVAVFTAMMPGVHWPMAKVVGELLLGGPALLLNHLALEDGEHGVAAAEGADPDLGEGPKQIAVEIHSFIKILLFQLMLLATGAAFCVIARPSSSSIHRAATASLGILQSRAD